VKPPHAEAAATYELTVTGAVGPVLRSALSPPAVASTEQQTILRAELDGNIDLVDLVLMLASRGLEITAVRDLP
jgi:hypothetical protein